MKINIKILLVGVSTLLISSCSYFNGKTNDTSSKVSKIEELSEPEKQHLNKQDSVAQDLVEKIDDLTRELNTSKQTIAELQQTINKNNISRSVVFFTGLALLLSIGNFLLFLIRKHNKKVVDYDKIIEEHMKQSPRFNKLLQNKFETLTAKNLNENVQQKKNGQQQIFFDSELQNLTLRVGQLETKVISLTSTLDSKVKTKDVMSKGSEQKSEYKKIGYTKLNSDKFFMDIFDSNQEGCVFCIKFTSPSRGEFDLISLDKIKSRNGWQDVIEYSGDCLPADATTYTIENKGICEKVDNDTWEVVNKLKIKISK